MSLCGHLVSFAFSLLQLLNLFLRWWCLFNIPLELLFDLYSIYCVLLRLLLHTSSAFKGTRGVHSVKWAMSCHWWHLLLDRSQQLPLCFRDNDQIRTQLPLFEKLFLPPNGLSTRKIVVCVVVNLVFVSLFSDPKVGSRQRHHAQFRF